jgi:ElaA protein
MAMSGRAVTGCRAIRNRPAAGQRCGPPSLTAVNAPEVHAAPFHRLSARTFHDIVRLRLDTFVVEQECSYHELDGRDILSTTHHLWIEEEGDVVSYLRLYPGPEGAFWIGRVVTAPGHRNRGLGAVLMNHALAVAGRPVRLSAQARLERWYGAFGFTRCGDDFLEDGIPHTPMVLERSPTARR